MLEVYNRVNTEVICLPLGVALDNYPLALGVLLSALLGYSYPGLAL